MPPAARKGDATAHGGTIVQGSPDTTIGGMPAARTTDSHVCPQHGTGPVTAASTTVFINSLGVARVGDVCTCSGGGGGAGGGSGAKTEPYKVRVGPSQRFYRDAKEWRTDEPGPRTPTNYNPKLSAELAHEFWRRGNEAEKTGAFETNIYSQKIHARALYEGDLKNFRNAKAKAGGGYEFEYTAVRVRGKAGDVKSGSFGEATAEVKVVSAKLAAGAGSKLEIKDGQLKAAYAAAAAGGGIALVEGKVAGKTRAFKIPFLNWGISFGGDVSGALLTAEAKASAFAGYRDHKWTFALGTKVGAALVGFGFNFSFSVEKLPAPVAPSAPPGVSGGGGSDVIVSGCTTVLVGGAPPAYVPGRPLSIPKLAKPVAGPDGMNAADVGQLAPMDPMERGLAATGGGVSLPYESARVPTTTEGG